jgi:hypothetical protein
VFSDIFAWAAPTFDLTTGGEAIGAGPLGQRRLLQGARRAGAHRLHLTTADDRRCAAPSAVLSYGFGSEHAGSPPLAIAARSCSTATPSTSSVSRRRASSVSKSAELDVAVPLCAEPFSRRPHGDGQEGRLVPRALGRLKPA